MGVGRIYISSDFGVTWSQRDSDRAWNGISVSSTGQYQTATLQNGNIYFSRDYGLTWSDRASYEITEGEQAGTSVSISADGSVVSIGSPYADTTSGIDSGRVRVFSWNGNAWTRRGTSMIGEGTNNYSGWSTSMSADANTVAIGAPYNNNAQGIGSGQVRVYKWNGLDWGMTGTVDIDGEAGVLVPSRVVTTAVTSVTKNWRVNALSLSGQYQTAVVDGGNIWTSFNYGITWTERTSFGGTKSWTSISLSSSGQYQTSLTTGGNIWTSSDFGVTWTERTSSTGDTKNWISVSISSNGQYQSAAVNGGNIWTSSDFGITWTERTPTGGTKSWYMVSISSSGVRQTAVVNGGNIWISADFGITWLEVTTGGTKSWRSVSLSSSGQYQTSVASGNNIWTSSDFGVSWTERTTGGTKSWYMVSLSSSGQYQSAVVNSGSIWISSNFGVSWTERSPTGSSLNWYSISLSSSGQYQAATISNGLIYFSRDYGFTWSEYASYEIVSSGDQSGYSISLSSNGNSLAVGAPYNDAGSTGADRGHVRVYDLNVTTNTWSPRGPDIDGQSIGDLAGWSVSMSADGSTVAFGAPMNDGSNNLVDTGRVRVFNTGVNNPITYISNNSRIADIYGNLLMIKANTGNTNILAIQNNKNIIGSLTVGATNTLIYYENRAWWVAGGRNQIIIQPGGPIYLHDPGNASIAYTSDPSGVNGWTIGTGISANGGDGIYDLEQINDIAFSPHTQSWLAVGLGSVVTPTRTALYSEDGISWTSAVVSATDASLNLNTCAWNQLDASASSTGRWIAGGTRSGVDANAVSLYISVNVSGASWTPIVGTGAILSQVYSLAYNGRVWIAAGTPATSNGSTSTLMRTMDPTGSSGWHSLPLTNISTSGFDTAARSITWNADNNMWISTGENTGTTADASFSSVIYSLDVTGAAGTWRSVRESNSFCFSDEGISVAFKGDKWFAAGQGTNQIVATTGATASTAATAAWTPIAHGTALTSISDIAYTGRRLIATGSSSGGTSNGLIYTTDNSGSVWTAAPATPGPGFTDALGGGTSITIEPSIEGGAGYVVATGRSATNAISISTDGGVTWNVSGAPSVQFSTNVLYAYTNYALSQNIRTYTVGFPVLNSLPNWIIDISFTRQTNGANHIIVGSMYNTVDAARGWGIFIGSGQQIAFVANDEIYNNIFNDITVNIAYTLNVIKVGNILTFRLTNLSTMVVSTNTITITKSLGLGPVDIGSTGGGGEVFIGTIGYVVVSDYFKSTPSTTTQPLFTTGGNNVAYVGNDTIFLGGGNDVQWTGKRWVATGRNTSTSSSVASATVGTAPLIDFINNNISSIATSDDGMTWQSVSASQAPTTSDGLVIASNSRIGPTPLINSQIIISDGADAEPNADYGGMTCGMGGSGTGVAQIDIIAELPPVSNAASSISTGGAVNLLGVAGNSGSNLIGNAPIASFDTASFAITTRLI